MFDFFKAVMGQPTIRQASDVAATLGDTTLVAAPGAGKRLIILYLRVQNETANATIALLKAGEMTLIRARIGQNLTVERDYQYPLVLPANTALVLNLNGANNHGYIVDYVIAPA